MSREITRAMRGALKGITTRYKSCLVDVNGELTFAGVLVKYFFPSDDGRIRGISDPWKKQTTLVNYADDYRARLIQEIPKFKAISQITAAELEDAIERMVKRYGLQHQRENHYRKLIRYVFEAAHRAGINVEENIWGSMFFSQINVTTQADKEFLKIPKSLTAFESVSLYASLTENVTEAPGEDLGLLLMFFCGCRNAEVVPVSFEQCVDIDGYPDVKNIAIHETATRTRDVVKSGGKSSNAYRFLPIPSALWEIIMQRRAMLENTYVSGSADYERHAHSIGAYPIACYGHEHQKRSLVDDLSRRGRYHLRKIKYNANKLAAVDVMMISERRLDNRVEEKDPTAYLLRRHSATMLYVLGFNDTEQQYLMGHAIADAYTNRRNYSNEDLRYALWEKLEKHPICEMIRRYGKEAFHDARVCEQIKRELKAGEEKTRPSKRATTSQLDVLYDDYARALLDYHRFRLRN